MEKLLNFEDKSKHEYQLYRFQCSCLASIHALDIEVESSGTNSEEKYITLRLDSDRDSFLEKIKAIWSILTNKWSWREFVVRKEDYRYLSEIFDPDKKYYELP